jgi:hypothetical protein
MFKDLNPGCVDGGCGGCSSCTGTICVTATYYAPIPGATVTVKLGATTIGTCTTDATGKCCVSITAAGTYTVTVSKTGFTTTSTTVSATCTTNNVTVTMGGTTLNYLCVYIDMCGVPIQEAGVTVSISGGGSSASLDTASGACCMYCNPSSSISVSWNAPARGTSGTATVTSGAAGASTSRGVSVTLASGYHCLCLPTMYPAKDSLVMTESYRGASINLSYNGGNTDWEGSGTVAYPGCGGGTGSGGCDAQTANTLGLLCKTVTLGLHTPEIMSFSVAGDPTYSTCPGTGGTSAGGLSFQVHDVTPGAIAFSVVTEWTPAGGVLLVQGSQTVSGTSQKYFSTGGGCTPTSSTITLSVTE